MATTPLNDDALRDVIRSELKHDTSLTQIHRSMIAAGHDVDQVDRLIAEEMRERSKAKTDSKDPFLVPGSRISAKAYAAKVANAPHEPSKIARIFAHLSFVIGILGALGLAFYLYPTFFPEPDPGCPTGGATSLLCVEMVLTRYYEDHGTYPQAMEDLLQQYATEPFVDEATGEAFAYTQTHDGYGYRICTPTDSEDELCSERSVRTTE